jgi:hypothetical protein
MAAVQKINGLNLPIGIFPDTAAKGSRTEPACVIRVAELNIGAVALPEVAVVIWQKGIWSGYQASAEPDSVQLYQKIADVADMRYGFGHQQKVVRGGYLSR